MSRLFADLYRHRELLGILVARNLKIRYRGSALGFFWTLLNPIFFIVIYATFLGLLKVDIGLPLLVTGIIVWNFFDMTLSDGLYAVIGNANLVKKTAFTRLILPLSMVISNTVNFLLSLVVLFAYLLIDGQSIQHLWLLPLLVLTQAALCLGMALIVSTLNVYFRDTEHLLGVGKLAWFFLTPVIYPIAFVFEHVPPLVQKLAFLNPMTGVITAYRWVMLSSDIIAPRLVLGSHLICWGVLVVGVLVFQRYQRGFADVL